MAKLKAHFMKLSIKKALLQMILLGTIVAGIMMLLFLQVWHLLMFHLTTALATHWFLGGVGLYFGGAIIGSFAVLYAVMNVMARMVYRLKFAPPLAQLKAGVAHIQAQDLDFELHAKTTDELGQLVGAFEAMRQALRQALEEAWQLVEDQKQVNAAFAHDLRTPLTVLQGNLELLTMADKDEQPDRALLAEMHQQLDRMTAFIQTMSHLSALQNRQLTGEAMTPATLEQQLKEEASKLVPAIKTVTWKVENQMTTNESLAIAPDVVLEVFDNQLTNACRFAAEQVAIHLTATANGLTIKVDNDGPPLTPGEQAKAKLPYFSSDRQAQHLGVGMYICTQLCAAHRGHFTIANQPDTQGVSTIAEFGYLTPASSSTD